MHAGDVTAGMQILSPYIFAECDSKLQWFADCISVWIALLYCQKD